MGTGFCGGQHTAIQGLRKAGGAVAPACVVGVCTCVFDPCAGCRCLSEGSRSSGSASGAERSGGGSIPGIGGLPPIPLNTGWGLPSTCSSTGGGAHCCRCVWFPRVPVFLGLGQNERDLHPIHRYRWWRELLKGGVVPTTPTGELYVQGSQEHQLPGSNPRTGRLKTYALTIGPCESLALYGGSAGYESNPKGGGRVL